MNKLLQPPKAVTLAKYGLSEEQWWALLVRQGSACAVCKKAPKTGKYNIDHDHIRGWKKLPPERRRQHVRGLLCWFCNTYYLGRCITVAKAENVVAYLKAYEALAAMRAAEERERT